MKRYICLLLFWGLFTACSKNYLDQEPTNIVNEKDAYSSLDGINGIVSNLYASLRFEQDFATDNESYDICRFDEAYNNSDYGNADDGLGSGYRSYYDYSLIRQINLHLENLKKYASPSISAAMHRYLVAEGRFLRAMVYFTMVEREGGVPLITEAYDYSTTDLTTLGRPRSKEAAVYDFIASEVDSIASDLDIKSSKGYAKNRATKGAALALKCRAMLYAGSIASNETINRQKNLILSSGTVGIPTTMAPGYYQKCLDAFNALQGLGYSLYKADISTDYATNYANIFIKKDADNPEAIFVKDYDGVNYLNGFTQRAIPRTLRTVEKSGSQINPVLNLAESYELVAGHLRAALKTNNGNEVIEEMDANSSKLNYIIYDNLTDIFQGRDPRLNGTILTPGSSFRGNALQLQAGLAVWNGSGYDFKSVDVIENALTASGMYNGEQMTGADGPHIVSDYCSKTGFLLRKYVDPTPGSESNGKSKVAYIVFRYGEMLLNAAEAAFQLNKKEEALGYINQVRERAAGASFDLALSELTMDRIMHERRIELAFEDHRFSDLKRWRLADQVWDGSPSNPQAVIYALWPYKIVAPGTSMDGKYLYRRLRLKGSKATSNYAKQPLKFPLSLYYSEIPADALSNNPQLEKNPNQ